MISEDKHFYFMQQALMEAQRAFDEEEVPVGAVVVSKDKIIGRGYNQTEKLADATAHAEMIAITAACGYLGSKYLMDCSIYISLEPCLMCAGAIYWVKLPLIFFGATDPKFGITTQELNLFSKDISIQGGILAKESSLLLKEFFKKKREL